MNEGRVARWDDQDDQDDDEGARLFIIIIFVFFCLLLISFIDFDSLISQAKRKEHSE